VKIKELNKRKQFARCPDCCKKFNIENTHNCKKTGKPIHWEPAPAPENTGGD